MLYWPALNPKMVLYKNMPDALQLSQEWPSRGYSKGITLEDNWQAKIQ
jgi:hypothetical protein